MRAPIQRRIHLLLDISKQGPTKTVNFSGYQKWHFLHTRHRWFKHHVVNTWNSLPLRSKPLKDSWIGSDCVFLKREGCAYYFVNNTTQLKDPTFSVSTRILIPFFHICILSRLPDSEIVLFEPVSVLSISPSRTPTNGIGIQRLRPHMPTI